MTNPSPTPKPSALEDLRKCQWMPDDAWQLNNMIDNIENLLAENKALREALKTIVTLMGQKPNCCGDQGYELEIAQAHDIAEAVLRRAKGATQ